MFYGLYASAVELVMEQFADVYPCVCCTVPFPTPSPHTQMCCWLSLDRAFERDPESRFTSIFQLGYNVAVVSSKCKSGKNFEQFNDCSILVGI